MEIRRLLENEVAAMVEYYDNTAACDQANKITEEVKEILGANAPVYRINVDEDPREKSLVRLTSIPTIIIYRNNREEWRIISDFPDAQTLADRLTASMQAPGAINPLKGRPRK